MTPFTKFLIGDSRERLAELPAESVHCCVTSPPYFGLRDYGVTGQLGLEASPDEYVAALVAVFREVRRVLRPDATLWLNLGDSYANDGKWGGHTGGKHAAALHCSSIGRNKRYTGIKPKDLIGIPWMVAFALRADGWWLRQDIIWCLSGGTRVYARTQKGDMPMTIKDLVRLDPATVKLWNGERWTQVQGWSQTPRPDRTYEIELRSGERIGCTANHEWPVEPCGNKRADELRVGQIIRRCRLPEPDLPRRPAALDDAEIGWLIGTFLADGSWSHDRTALTIASHVNEEERFERLRQIAERWDASYRIAWTEGNGSNPIIHSRILAVVIQTYLSGENAKGKHLDVRCWRRTNAFLHHLLIGYLQGDGHYEIENNRWRIGFTQNDALAADLRTLCARLGYQLRLKRYDHQSQWGIFPGWRGEIRFTPSPHFNTRNDGEIVAIRESRARKFWDIGVADEPHLFALASGILTHNSKPNPMPESVTDRCTKAHEYLFLLSKSANYYYDADAIAEPAEEVARKASPRKAEQAAGRLVDQRTAAGFARGVAWGNTRNKRSVWTINTQPNKFAHFATFPQELVKNCILAGTSEKGVCAKCGAPQTRIIDRQSTSRARGSSSSDFRAITGPQQSSIRTTTTTIGWKSSCKCNSAEIVPAIVLDPFFGSGTTGVVAQHLWRSCIGIDLSDEYAQIGKERMPSGLLYNLEVIKDAL